MSVPIGKIKDSTRTVEKQLVELLSDTIIEGLKAKAPWTALPIIKSLIHYGIRYLLYFLSEESIILFNQQWIRIKLGADAEELEKVRRKARQLIDGDFEAREKYIEQIDRELVDAFDRLHRLGRGPL